MKKFITKPSFQSNLIFSWPALSFQFLFHVDFWKLNCDWQVVIWNIILKYINKAELCLFFTFLARYLIVEDTPVLSCSKSRSILKMTLSRLSLLMSSSTQSLKKILRMSNSSESLKNLGSKNKNDLLFLTFCWTLFE